MHKSNLINFNGGNIKTWLRINYSNYLRKIKETKITGKRHSLKDKCTIELIRKITAHEKYLDSLKTKIPKQEYHKIIHLLVEGAPRQIVSKNLEKKRSLKKILGLLEKYVATKRHFH